jgi:hypothetical protein
MTRPAGRLMLVLLAGAGIGLLTLGGCNRVIVSPLAVPPYRSQMTAAYDDTWKALVRALMMDNLPLRVVAKDSGVIASDDFVSPIGVYADCGRFGDAVLEGEALIAFTVFVQPGRDSGTEIQVNAKMRTQTYRRGPLGIVTTEPVYQCVSTGRWEANLRDTVRSLVKE